MFDDGFDGYYSDDAGLTGAVLHEMLLSSVKLSGGWRVVNGRYSKSVFVVGCKMFRVVVILCCYEDIDQMMLCVLLFRRNGDTFHNIDCTRRCGDVSGNCSPLFNMSDRGSAESAVCHTRTILHCIVSVVDSGAYDEA